MDSTSIGSNGSTGDGPAKVPLTFARADQMYVSLKRLHDTGVLTADAFDEQLKQMMVKDSEGRWWSKSRDSGDWFYYDGTDWVRGVPPMEEPKLDVKPEPIPVLIPQPDPTPILDRDPDPIPEPIPDPIPQPTPDPIPIAASLAEPGPRTVAFLIDQGIFLVADIVCEAIGIGWLAWIIAIGYYAYYWGTTGQTLGMKSQNLRVVRVDGKPMTWETSAMRVVGYIVGSLCILIGLLWVYWDPMRQGWHDKMAQTLVVRDNQ